MHQITFPAHTQARMDATRGSSRRLEKAEAKAEAEAEKENKSSDNKETKPKLRKAVLADKTTSHNNSINTRKTTVAAALMTKDTNLGSFPSTLKKTAGSRNGPALPGYLPGLSVPGRQSLLNTKNRVIIAKNSESGPLILMDGVKIAIFQHFAPSMMQYQDTMKWLDHSCEKTILLPNWMYRVNELGVKYVVDNMTKAVEKGSYRSKWWTKDEEDEAKYTIRPRQDPVDMIHALYTLRAFGMAEDATFLAREKTGPIFTELRQQVDSWQEGNTKNLKRFLLAIEQYLLEEGDRHLLSGAWEAFNKRVESEASLSSK